MAKETALRLVSRVLFTFSLVNIAVPLETWRVGSQVKLIQLKYPSECTTASSVFMSLTFKCILDYIFVDRLADVRA